MTRPHRSRPPRRRGAVAAGAGLLLAAGGAAALAGAGAALGGEPTRLEATLRVELRRGEPLIEPPVVESRNGFAALDLTSQTTRTTIGGSPAISNVYDRLFPGRTLRLRPGDRFRIKLRNGGQFGEPTNLHTHGLHDSPRPGSDDVFISLPTDGSVVQRYFIPESQRPGLYWYHPHRHEYTQTQVFAGQAGAIVVRGGIDDLPGIRGLRDRLMVFQATQLATGARPIRAPSSSAPARQLQLINGQLDPRVDIRPGETQRWRILNASSDKFLVLRLQGHSMWLLSDDGNSLARPMRTTSQFIGPGERREVLVRASNRPGRYALQSLFFVPVRAQPDYSAPTRTIATMVVGGAPAVRRPIPDRLIPLPDLRGETVDRRRRIVFSESRTSPKFFVNGKLFDPDRIDQTMRLNDVEEWTIVNTTDEWHTFHIHVNPYQVTRINGKPVKGVNWQDDVSIAPYGGSITMRTRFEDFTGKFVFHCHVLFHEDNGMMSAVQVVRT